MFCSCDFCSWPVLTETIKCDMINGVTRSEIPSVKWPNSIGKEKLCKISHKNFLHNIQSNLRIGLKCCKTECKVMTCEQTCWHTSNVHPESEVHVSRGVKCLSWKISYQVRTSPCEKSQIALSPVSFANDIKHGIWLLWNACRYAWQEQSGRFPQDLLTNVFKCDVMENPFWKKGKVDTKDFCGTLPSTSTLGEPFFDGTVWL